MKLHVVFPLVLTLCACASVTYNDSENHLPVDSLKEVTAQSQSSQASVKDTTLDQRPECLWQEDAEIQKNWYQFEWISTPASEWVEFDEETIGLSLSLPYNPEWGSLLCKVLPYETRANAENLIVSFGPLVPGEGGTIRRDWYFETTPQMSTREVTAKFAKRADTDTENLDNYPPEYQNKIATLKIGNYDVVRFSTGGQFETDTYEVIGSDFNVIFRRHYSEFSRAQTEQIISSIKFDL